MSEFPLAILLVSFAIALGAYTIYREWYPYKKQPRVTVNQFVLWIFAIGFSVFAFRGVIDYINSDNDNPCSVSGKGFHMGNTIAIKFNSDGTFNSSDKLLNISKSFWGTWEQQGNTIITTCDKSTTGMGVGQKNEYSYNCNDLRIGGFVLEQD